MITRLLVIQSLDEKGNVDVYQITSDNFQWTFENRRTKIDGEEGFFPFIVNGNIDVLKRSPGAETRYYARENEVVFCDDYGVPGGAVIGILYPKNFIPDIIKFKDKPIIPVGLVGQVSTRPPGHIQILYNHLEKRCAIVFNIHENICFGFKSIARKVNPENFPRNENVHADDLFDITISQELLNVESISNEDLKIINDTLDKADIEEIHNTLNDLLTALKLGEKAKSKSLLKKASELLMNGTSVAGSLTTIVDSYKGGETAHKFISKVIEYVAL